MATDRGAGRSRWVWVGVMFLGFVIDVIGGLLTDGALWARTPGVLVQVIGLGKLLDTFRWWSDAKR